MKRIVCTVTSDPAYDQRMSRICSSLANAGYDVTLVGRLRKHSPPLQEKNFKQIRLNGWFETGFLFYAEYNLRLFFFLLFYPCDAINTIDLDSILPCFWVSKLRKKKIVYDAHEYFTEMEEVVSRPAIKRVWDWIEAHTVPKIPFGYTVSHGYAELFRKKYKVDYKVVRNVTLLQKPIAKKADSERYILYQGSVNVGRGLEVLIPAMQAIEDCKLYICGKGNLYDELVELTQKLQLENKVKFWGYIHPEELKGFTANAFVGITLFTNDGLSNQYSLANRFFDYMHQGVPQLAMNYPEYQNFNKEFEVAYLLDTITIDSITEAINTLKSNTQLYTQLQENALKAKEIHNFQADEKELLKVYENLFNGIE